MDKFIKFCLPLELQNWLNQYKAPDCETAIAKDIPNTFDNHLRFSAIPAKFCENRGKKMTDLTEKSARVCKNHEKNREKIIKIP